MIDLPDVNVWVALSSPGHPHHLRARRYWEEEAEVLAFCRVTSLGLTRVLCQRSSESVVPLLPHESWALYEQWRKVRQVSFLSESEDIEKYISAYVGLEVMSPRLWTDAYLAAFATSLDLRLVTFDKDFNLFPGLNLLTL